MQHPLFRDSIFDDDFPYIVSQSRANKKPFCPIGTYEQQQSSGMMHEAENLTFL